jgi:SAM-dependent methyltransferase
MGFQLSEIKLFSLSRHRQMLLSRIKMRVLRGFPEQLKKVLFYGKNCYCPVCESHIREYERFGHIARLWCPVCASMRWQRFAWLFLQHHTNLFDGMPKKMLHIAPEIAFEPRLKQVANLDYLTGDLFNPQVMVKVDITDMPFPNYSFDAIFCSHVMEHVPDDRKALRELMRVLSSGGWAIFLVPIRMNQRTDEDLGVTDSKERERRFGQHDHVRFYGWDFEERLRDAGFQVTVVRASDVIDANQFEQVGITKEEVLFYCQNNLALEN